MTNKIPSLELSKQFINGLKNYNLTIEEINKTGWKYCGGNKNSHLNYFKICLPDYDLPEQINECVCGHTIKENCYITDGNSILILGNCCIKKFVKKCNRICEICGEVHRNSSVNRCNDCRYGICDKCNKKCDDKYKKCLKCYYN